MTRTSMTTKQRVVSNPGITINLLTVELVAGIIPHAATGLIMSHTWGTAQASNTLTPQLVTPVTSLY